MISDKILNIFKSREDAISEYKSYVILIDDIKNNLNDACDQESMLIETTELRVPKDKVVELLQAYSSKKRTLEIVSSINVDRDGLYYGKLDGFIDSNNSQDEEELPPEILSRDISILKATLRNEISIEFTSPFIEQPIVHVTIDKKYENLYRDYSIEFIIDESNNTFIGANIIFKSLKLRDSYPPIGIIVIGDVKEDFYAENSKVMTFLVVEDETEETEELTTAEATEDETEEDICTTVLDDVINKMIHNANVEFVEQEENLKTNRCGKVVNRIEKNSEITYHVIVTKEGYETKTVEYSTLNDDTIIIKLKKINSESENENPETPVDPEEPVNPEEPGGNTNDSD